MPSASATDWTSAQRWSRALSKTSVRGTCQSIAPSFRSNWQTLSALLEVRLVTVLTSYVIAVRAPRTLKRCRPLGALIPQRAKHHREPSNAPKTTWAASTKKTARLPARASAQRGSNFFLIRLWHLRVALSRQQADLATLQTEVFPKQAALRRAAFEARQGVEHRDRCVDRLRRMGPYLCCHGISMRLQQALWTMKVELFQGFYTTGVRQLERGA